MKSRYIFIIFLSLLLVLKSEDYDYQGAFSKIYQEKTWSTNNGPLSGPGSEPCHFMQYLIALQKLIDRPDITSIVEIGFGDFQMMQHIILQGKNYVGYQVVTKILRESEDNKQFILISGLKDIQQTGDLLIVRDVMQHWPTSEIDYFIDNILPRYKFALLTNDHSDSAVNKDIQPGQFRGINLSRIGKTQILVEILQNQKLKQSRFYENPLFK